MEKVRIERLPIFELPFLRHYNLVLADGIIGGIAVHRLDGTYPSVVRYHPVHRLKGFAPIHLRHRVFLFQLLPQLWPNLFQIGLRHIEDMVRLQLRIDIILLPLFLRQQFIVLPLDVFLCFLIDHRKRGEHHGERVFALQYRHTGFGVFVSTARFVELLYAVESAEARNPITLLLTMQEQHHRIHTIVLTPVQVLWPLQRTLGKPRLLPSVFAAQRFYLGDHHLREEIQGFLLGSGLFIDFLFHTPSFQTHDR